MAAMTRLQEDLRDRLKALAGQESLWSIFARAWSEECGKDGIGDADALLDGCLSEDPLDLLQKTLNVAPALGSVDLGVSTNRDCLCEVVIGIFLISNNPQQ